MGKSKSKPKDKSEHSEHPLINPPTRTTGTTTMKSEVNTQHVFKPKLQWLSQTTPTPIQIPWSKGQANVFGPFVKQAAQ